jgi:hypothetical protein
MLAKRAEERPTMAEVGTQLQQLAGEASGADLQVPPLPPSGPEDETRMIRDDAKFSPQQPTRIVPPRSPARGCAGSRSLGGIGALGVLAVLLLLLRILS